MSLKQDSKNLTFKEMEMEEVEKYYISYHAVTPYGKEFNSWLMEGNINYPCDIDFIVDEIIKARYTKQCSVTIISWQRLGS